MRSAPGPIRRLLQQAARHRGLVAATLVATVVGMAADVVMPLLSRSAVDQATGAAAGASLPLIVAGLVALSLVVYAGHLGRRLAAGALALRVQNSLRHQLLDTLLHLPGAAADQIRTGQVVSRSISDLQQMQGLMAMGPLAIGAVLQVFIAVAIMAYLSPALTVVALLIIPAVAAVAFRSRRKLYAATWAAQQSAADVAGHVEESVTGVRVVKGFGQEQRAVDDLVTASARLYAERLRVGRYNARFAPTMAAIPQLGLVAVLAVGGLAAYRGDITAGTFLAFTSYVATMSATARILTNVLLSAQLASASAGRVFDVIDAPSDDEPALPATPPSGAVGVEFAGVGFGFDAPVLDDFTLRLAPGECVAIVGGPGSGKTTVADLLARHYRTDRGAITLFDAEHRVGIDDLASDDLHRLVSTVPDEPFLYSTTVADNIALAPGRAGAQRDAAFRAAAEAAEVTEFASALPDGFATVVGERGLTLSGGQRQRIALARALYADPAVLILDDATSAVDATTEARILARLRQRRHTMLVLAHRRSTLALADRVAVLDGGRIVDHGTVDELEARSSLFAELMTEAPLSDEPADDHPAYYDAADYDPSGDTAVTDAQLWPSQEHRPVTHNALGAAVASESVARALDTLVPATEEPGVDASVARRDDPSFSLRQILRPVRWLLVLAIALVAVDTVVGLAFPSLARITIDAATAQHGAVLAAAAISGAVLVVVGWLSAAKLTMTTTRAGERVLFSLRVRSFAHLQRLGLDYYERELSGRIMTRMTTDIDALSTFLQTGLATAAVAALTLVGVSVALVVTDPPLGALILVPVLPILLVSTIWFRRVAAASYRRARELVSAVNADFAENIAGLRTTVDYRHTAAARARFADRTAAWYRARMSSQRAVSLYFPFIILLSNLAAAVAVAVGATQLAGGADAGTLIAFLLYLTMLFGPIQQLTQVFDGYQQAAVGLSRIGDLLRTPSSVVAVDAPRTPPADGFAGHSRLDDVTFAYAGSSTPALHHVDLDIPPGTSLALVGRTGAGKSTVVKLLARFYDATDGSVRMDGTDIRDFDLAGYRSRLAIVPQEPYLFSGTVAANIAYGRPDASHAEIRAAAAAVGALTMIAGLPAGMRSQVGERGQGLSSGQRQLIALARAELVAPDLILLDEATATLDQATEARVLAAGRRVTRTRTSVIVAHRLATAARADRIAVVAGGRVVECGTHAQLLSAGGLYRRFFDDGATMADQHPSL